MSFMLNFEQNETNILLSALTILVEYNLNQILTRYKLSKAAAIEGLMGQKRMIDGRLFTTERGVWP